MKKDHLFELAESYISQTGISVFLTGRAGTGKTTFLKYIVENTPKRCVVLAPTGVAAINAGGVTIHSFFQLPLCPYLPDEVPAPRRAAIEFAKDHGQYWVKFSIEKFSEIMKVFDTDENQRMDQMSYGQLKKTFIAFALACNTRYLFMDEPTNGLDIPSKAQFRKAVSKYTSDDSTLLISTHQARDLEAIIDPIIILDHKDVLLNASLDEIAEKLYFDYSSEADPDALYSEMVPGGNIQVLKNVTGAESKVNIEALFNAVLLHKDVIKDMFNK